MKVGQGLFTKVERKKNDYIVGFPGYWMESRVFGLAASRENHYAFSVPNDDHEWASMRGLVYVTHPSQANHINAGKVDGEVM